MIVSPPQRILIVLLGAIGDVTRALPLAVRLKRHWPEAELSWAVEPRSADLLKHHPCIDRIVVFDRPRGFPAFVAFLREIRDLHFDLVLDLQRHFKSGVTSFATRAPVRIGFNRRNAKEFNWVFNTSCIPAVDNLSLKLEHYQLFGDVLELPRGEPLEFGLQFSTEELIAAEQMLRTGEDSRPLGRIGLILGSTWQSRLWPTEHYACLVELLFERKGLVSVLIGGPSESAAARQIVERSGTKSINLTGATTLRQAAAVLKLCDGAVGPDSGPMHIAAAVGTKVVSLWGATSPKRSAPFGGGDLVLQSAVGCSPCYRRVCPGLGTLCMDEIAPEAVYAAVQRALDVH